MKMRNAPSVLLALAVAVAVLTLPSPSSLSHIVAEAAFIPPTTAATRSRLDKVTATMTALGASSTPSFNPLGPLRLLVPLLLPLTPQLVTFAPIPAAVAAETAMVPAAAAKKEPSNAQLQAVRDAFKAFDGKDLAKADRLFDQSVKVRVFIRRMAGSTGQLIIDYRHTSSSLAVRVLHLIDPRQMDGFVE